MSASYRSTAVDDDNIRDLFVTGLRNAHAVEKQAIQLIERQLDRIEHYPDVASKLRQHLAETRQQHERLDRILESFDESRSILKDMAMEFSANMGALMHGAADDEILKNTFANNAFENYEIAAYKSLITMAEMGGFSQHVPALQESLREEQEMARWIDQNVEAVTRVFVERYASDQKADR
jgi:ferritin-like metal-binding protein YciE